MKTADNRQAGAGGLALRASGRRDRDTLVLLHGFGGSGRSFDPVIDDLGALARLILPDLPGHGGSVAAAGSRHPRTAADAVLAALDDAGCERFHLAGFSLGGAVACLIALAAPDRVRSLTLLAPGGFGPDIAHEALRDLAAARDPSEIRAALAAMSAPGASLPENEVAMLAEERKDLTLKAELMAIAETIAKDGRQGTFPREVLATIACPVRVVWGTKDPVLPVTQSRNLPEPFRVRLVDGAGHMLIHEARDAVTDVLREALADSTAR